MRLTLLLSVAVALSTISCKKESKKKASDPSISASKSQGASRPISGPSGVVATVQLPTGVKAEGLAKFVDNVEPGASAMVAASIPMALGQVMGMDLSDADLNAPIAAVVLSPKKHEKPFALLLTPKDVSALESKAQAAGLSLVSKNDLVLLGEASVIESVANLAFGTLGKPPAQMVARIYPSELVVSYKDDLHAALSTMGDLISSQQGANGTGFRTLMMAYEEMIVALGEQTESIEMRIGASDGASDLFFRIQPRPGTTLAQLVLAQVPTAHELLAKLPPSSAGTMLFSGELHAGAAQGPMIEFSSKVFAAMLPIESAKVTELFTDWFEGFNGKMAVNMSMNMSNPIMPEFSATYLWGAADATALRNGWREMFGVMVAGAKEGTLDMMGMKIEIDFAAKAEVIDGIEIDRYHSKVNLDHLSPEEQRVLAAAQLDQTMHMAAFDDVAVMAMSTKSADTVSDAIAAARGRGPGYTPTGSLKAAIERSKSLGESMVFAMDIGGLVPPEVPMPFSLMTAGFGRDGDAFTMRMSVRK